MEELMSFVFNNETPIYLQLIDDIKLQIINKVYLPNAKLPSVRELSVMYEVNPNTIQKALAQLEEEKLIFTERTNGKYVTDDLSLIHSIRDTTIHNMIDDFYVSMSRLGLNKEQVLQILNNERNNYGYFTSKEYYKKI